MTPEIDARGLGRAPPVPERIRRKAGDKHCLVDQVDVADRADAAMRDDYLEGIIGHQVGVVDDDQRAPGEAAAVHDELVGGLALDIRPPELAQRQIWLHDAASMRWWFTPDVTSWTKTADEVIGLREKLWVVDSLGALWLRKKPLSWRATELAIEAFTLELARRCGYGVAFGRCCTWETEEGVVRGFVSRKFHDTTEEQSVGGLLLAPKLDLPADLAPDVVEARRRALSTIELTRTVLKEQEARYRVDLVGPFLRMLVFDAWIGNGDRHAANWAILVRGSLHGSECRLAPMYDTAGCLLADLTDDTVNRRFGTGLEDAAVQRYVEKCRSGFGDGLAEPGILHRDLLERLRGWPEWKAIAAPLIEFFFENLPVVRDLLGEIPPEWLNERRKHLIRRLLEARVMMLRGFVS